MPILLRAYADANTRRPADPKRWWACRHGDGRSARSRWTFHGSAAPGAYRSTGNNLHCLQDGNTGFRLLCQNLSVKTGLTDDLIGSLSQFDLKD